MQNIINEHKSKYSPENKDDLIDLFLHEMYNENGSNSVFNGIVIAVQLIDNFKSSQ